MAKKKNHWYILVMTNVGPVFVTNITYQGKTAQWNKDEKPLELSEYQAKDVALGLMLNFHSAYPICAPVELDHQPYRYETGQFEWKENIEEGDSR